MKYTTTISLFILITKLSIGQISFLPNDISKSKDYLPNNIKKITQYKGENILNVSEYDKSKNLIFNYYKQYVGEEWNFKYLTMITGNVYNESRQILKSYNLHSNTGISIWYHEYDNKGNNTKVFMRNNDYEHHDSLINKNPYHFISEIKNMHDLINHTKIMDIESNAVNYLFLEQIYDNEDNLITEVAFKENGDTSSIQRYDHDKNNNEVYFYKQSTIGKWEYFYEYEKSNSSFENKNKKNKLLQSVRVDYDWREKRNKISDITFYKYDSKNRLIQITKYDEGIFQDKYVYRYNNLNQVTKRLSYVYDQEKLVREEEYEYNKEGNIITINDQDYRSGKNKVTKYTYEYEYYR